MLSLKITRIRTIACPEDTDISMKAKLTIKYKKLGKLILDIFLSDEKYVSVICGMEACKNTGTQACGPIGLRSTNTRGDWGPQGSCMLHF